MDIHPKLKLWLENSKGDFLLGEGTFKLLNSIEDTGSLSDAARSCNISYAHAWKKIRKVEKKLGKPLVERSRGGVGGGHSSLTPAGEKLLEIFKTTRDDLQNCLKSVYH